MRRRSLSSDAGITLPKRKFNEFTKNVSLHLQGVLNGRQGLHCHLIVAIFFLYFFFTITTAAAGGVTAWSLTNGILQPPEAFHKKEGEGGGGEGCELMRTIPLICETIAAGLNVFFPSLRIE
jgi:hypothetical protein